MANVSNRSNRKPFIILGVIILTVYFALVAVFITLICTSNTLPDLKTTTGTISSFNHHEKDDPNVIDYWANDTASYLDVKFTDGTYFRAIGIRYNNIDSGLFSKIAVGEEITIAYEEKGFGGGPNLIYGIEYLGTTYLNTENVLNDLKTERKASVTGYSIGIAVLTVVAGGALITSYLTFKRKNKQKIN